MDSSIVVLSGVALALVPVVVAVTSIIKGLLPDNRFSALISLAVGVLGAWLIIPGTVGVVILTGIVIGLTASGAYSGTKSVVNG